MHWLSFLLVLLPSYANASTLYDVLQHDLLAAFSWAALDIEPDTYTHNLLNTTLHTQVQEDFFDEEPLKKSAIVKKSIFPESFSQNSSVPLQRKRRQIISLQGTRVILKLDVRPLYMKILNIYQDTNLITFFGVGVKSYLDDVFQLKQRSTQDNMIGPLEDIIGMLGVDGKACVHRLLCDMGASPAMKTEGLLGELVNLTIRFLLAKEYEDLATNNNIVDEEKLNKFDSVGYIDAVSAGKHGADCAALFNTCPISLIKMIQIARDIGL